MNSLINQKDKISPPYIPLSTFLGLIAKFKKSSVPQRIDNSILQNIAGGIKSHLIATLRFFHLINESKATTSTFQNLVEAYETNAWKEILTQIVQESYHTIINGLDLSTATSAQLDELFKKNSNLKQGQVLQKAIRFYLSILREAGVAVSPHFKVPHTRIIMSREKRGNTLPKNKKASVKLENKAELAEQSFRNNSDVIENFTIPIPGKSSASISVPKNLTAEDWNMLKIILEAYIKRLQEAG